MYFINEKEAVKFLVDFVLPYLNTDSPTFKEIEEIYAIFSDNEKIDFNEISFLATEEKEDKNLDIVKVFNDIYIKLLKKKYVEKYNALNNLQNEVRRLEPNIKIKSIKDNIFILSDNVFIGRSISNFDNFMIWLLKTPLNKSFAKKRHLDFIETEDYIDKDFFFSNIEEAKEGIFTDYTNTLKTFFNRGVVREARFYGLASTFLVNDSNVIKDYSIFDLIEQITSYAVLKCLYSAFAQVDENFDTVMELCEKGYDRDQIQQAESDLGFSIYDNMTLGEGFKYIGLCPVCQKLFKKNRSDKEYCSLKCSKLATSRIAKAKAKARNKNLITD